MVDPISREDRISAALQQLKLYYSYEPRPDGLWHVSFSLADGTSVMLTVYSTPLVAAVISVVGDLNSGWVPPDSLSLLRMFTDLWLTKVIAQDTLVSVTAQLPADLVDAGTLMLAINGVLEGVKRIRGTTSMRLLEP